ncbi:MAG: DUF6029 family protein [candidate division WOR-3 bacterium]
MRILFLFLFSLSFSGEGEYKLSSKDLSDYFYFAGSAEEQFGAIHTGIDYVLQLNSDVLKNKLYLFPNLSGQLSVFRFRSLYFSKSLLEGVLLNAEPNIPLRLRRYLMGLNGELYFKTFTLGLLTGRVFNYRFDGKNYFLESDTLDVVRGLYGSGEVGSVVIEAGYVRLNRKNMPEPYAFQEILAGKVGFNLPCFSLQLLLASKQGVDPILLQRNKGLGFYGSSLLNLGVWSLSLSGHYYDSLDFFGYNTPPVITGKELLPHGGNSDKGISINSSIGLENAYLKMGAASVIGLNEHNFIRPLSGSAIQELSLGCDLTFNSNLTVNLECGRELLLRIEPEYIRLNSYFMKMGLSTSHFRDLDLEVRPALNFEDSLKYLSIDLHTGLQVANALTAIINMYYSSESLSRYEYIRFWPYAEIRYKLEFGYLFIGFGSERGGLVCSGGICRYVSPFKGLKMGVSLGI